MQLFPSHENFSKVLILRYVEQYDRISHSLLFVPEIALVTIQVQLAMHSNIHSLIHSFQWGIWFHDRQADLRLLHRLSDVRYAHEWQCHGEI